MDVDVTQIRQALNTGLVPNKRHATAHAQWRQVGGHIGPIWRFEHTFGAVWRVWDVEDELCGEGLAVLRWEGGEVRAACSACNTSWCPHQVALAAAVVQRTPEERERLPNQGPLPGARRETVVEWCLANGVTEVSPVGRTAKFEQMLDEACGWTAPAWSRSDAWGAFMACEPLRVLADSRRPYLNYRVRARDWRDVQPDDPRAAAVWDRLQAALSAQGLTQPALMAKHDGVALIEGLHGDGAITVAYKGVEAELHFDRAETVAPVAFGYRDHIAAILEACLDALALPASYPVLAAALDDASRVEPWAHAFAALDAALAEHTTAKERGEVGWMLNFNSGNAPLVDPVWAKVGPQGGVTTRKWDGALDGLAAEDRERIALWRALQVQRQHRPEDGHLLDRLVGHPRVMNAAKRPVRVERALLRLHVRPDGDKIRLSWTFGNAPVDGEQVRAMLKHAGEAHLVAWDAGPVLRVGPLPAAGPLGVQRLLELPDELPRRLASSLIAKLAPLQKGLSVIMEGDLAGVPVAADDRLFIRLSVTAEDGLQAVVKLRPLPEAEPWPPGEGPEQLSALRDGVRVVVQRDLGGEVAATRARLHALGWHGDFYHTTDDLDEALDLVMALQAAGDDVVVVWDTKPWRLEVKDRQRIRVRGMLRDHLLDVDGELDVDGAGVSLAQVLEAIRDGRRWVTVQDGEFVRLGDEVRRRLLTLAHATWSEDGQTRASVLAAEALAKLADDEALVSLSAALADQVAAARDAGARVFDPPVALKATLRPYQRDGFTFLARLATWAPGAVLADEMGLGKTLQALTLLLHRADVGPALVVAPASVVDTWVREAARFAPSLRVTTRRGSNRPESLGVLAAQDVIVTSWDLLVRDRELLGATRFSTLVLDEAHAIKNPSTGRSKAVKALCVDFTLALTGTPIENRLDELWALFSRVVPGLLGSADRFRRTFVRAIEVDADAERRASLAALIQPFLLRRRKREVARELPDRVERVEVVALNPRERVWYDAARQALLDALEDGDLTTQRLDIYALAALTRLRQLACHPRLVHPEAPPSSTKLDRLRELVAEIRANDAQVLVFSQFTSLLDLVQPMLAEDGARMIRLDGSTPPAARHALVDQFQAGKADVFLLSLKAGGVGLTLTAASYVILLDPWWNPAVEAQAADRAHRIGQDKQVTVIRLLAEDTIEETVAEMQADKRALVEGLLDEAAPTTKLNPAALRALLAR